MVIPVWVTGPPTSSEAYRVVYRRMDSLVSSLTALEGAASAFPLN